MVKDRPLTLQHIPVHDAWRADECTLRGVTADYVRKRLRFEELWTRGETKRSKQT